MRFGINQVFLALSTMGPIGYLKAPGTMATIATLPIVLVIRSIMPTSQYLIVLFFSTIFAFFCIKKSLVFFKNGDPSEIVIDEYIGCLVTFCALPMQRSTLLLGFLFFRFFDILKCFGIKYCARL